MDAKIQLWLVMALMSIAAYPSTDCCSCLPNHPQRAFCNSGFVIRAKFLGATFTDMVDEYFGNLNYSLIQYEIETLEVFKGGSEIQHLKFIYTETLYSCEYYVSPSDYNKDYLITGEMQNGRVELILCNYIVPWSELSETQKKGMEGAYMCDCKICHSYECIDITSKYCEFNGHHPWKRDLDPKYSDQEDRDQMCAPNENGECTWGPEETLLSTTTTSELKTTE
ncbi:metalloproteinase inhibitor 1-like [Lissotriton helveticus]